MASPNGLLSQAIQNLQNMSKQLAALVGLPENARAIEASAIGLLQVEVSAITAIQATVAKFVAASLPSLQEAKTNVDNGANRDQVASAITQANASAKVLKQSVDGLSAEIKATREKIADLLTNSLAPIEGQLNAQKIPLDTQLQSAQQEADTIRNTEKYFAFLGFFGLIGLAGAAIALVVQEGKVNGLQAQVSKSRAQIAVLSLLIQSVNSMMIDFGDIISQISSISNAVNFVASDASQVINDLNNTQGEQVQVKIYLHATISQLQILGNDAI